MRSGNVSLAPRPEILYNDERKEAVRVLYEWGERFEWDDEKARLNYAKHKIRFETATAVFDDENRIEWYDAAHSEDEDRYNTIGMVRNILFVVYTERRDKIRIISARLATAEERRIYYAGDI